MLSLNDVVVALTERTREEATLLVQISTEYAAKKDVWAVRDGLATHYLGKAVKLSRQGLSTEAQDFCFGVYWAAMLLLPQERVASVEGIAPTASGFNKKFAVLMAEPARDMFDADPSGVFPLKALSVENPVATAVDRGFSYFTRNYCGLLAALNVDTRIPAGMPLGRAALVT